MHTRPSATFARAASVIAVATVATIVVACAGGSDPGWTYMPLPPSTPPASASGSPGASGTPAATATPAASASAPVPSGSASANVIELEETNALQILQNGQQVTMLNVVAGQTYTFRINNTAGFDHDLYLGPPDKLQANDVTGLPGVPVNQNGVQEFTWTADATATGWEFGCTVPGHYSNMHGTLMLGGQ